MLVRFTRLGLLTWVLANRGFIVVVLALIPPTEEAPCITGLCRDVTE